MLDWTFNVWTVGSAFVAALMMMFGFGFSAQRLYYQFDKRVSKFETEIGSHAKTLESQGLRIERWETAMMKVTADLQRAIGRLEFMQGGGSWDGRTERRSHDAGGG